MCLKGKLADLMVIVKPTLYCKYLTHDKKGTAVLYVTMNKYLYGFLASALVFYKKFVADLKEYGFKFNPYDPCVANMDINGSQMTVCWHVDDFKVSHKDPFEVTKLSTYLAGIYGDKITVTRGPLHEYLGMDLYFSEKGNANISMIKYNFGVLEEFPEEITGSIPTLYTDNLFTVRDEKNATYFPKIGLCNFTVHLHSCFFSCRGLVVKSNRM